VSPLSFSVADGVATLTQTNRPRNQLGREAHSEMFDVGHAVQAGFPRPPMPLRGR
jgi:hypothetical protein